MDQRFLQHAFVTRLHSNADQRLVIPKFTKDAIIEEMNYLRSIHCTYVHKLTCPKTMQQKFCNAIMTNKLQNKTAKKKFEKMLGDIVTEEWLYGTAVGLHGCSDWFNDVMDQRKTNQVFELPVASLIQNVPKKEKEIIAPVLNYPQDREGACIVLTLSSAFFYMLDIILAAKIFQKKISIRRV